MSGGLLLICCGILIKYLKLWALAVWTLCCQVTQRDCIALCLINSFQRITKCFALAYGTGTSRKKHYICAVYWTLGNLTPGYQSSLCRVRLPWLTVMIIIFSPLCRRKDGQPLTDVYWILLKHCLFLKLKRYFVNSNTSTTLLLA